MNDRIRVPRTHLPRRRALAIGALVAVFALTACAAGTAPMGGNQPNASDTASQANAEDQMFVAMMIPHHEQAIEMSDAVLGKEGIDPRVSDLAQRIKEAQQPEIDQMEAWLDDWGMGSEGGHGMGHSDGMMSEADMEALEAAEGDEASRLYLEQMIEHHEGAVDMAEDAVEAGQHPDVIALAQQMADAQTAEIAEMEQLLTEL
ncbi:DUF305 domain-containing protein [Agrococcus beijingensis]|uniref:DUF305 domain-containing protein n=1 Tax=Agrococcus beijingensis TaxID=3068634 RepID=UPI00274193E8|nr:DUF305 domain-containing protein [Agrococcus sp. REN33]